MVEDKWRLPLSGACRSRLLTMKVHENPLVSDLSIINMLIIHSNCDYRTRLTPTVNSKCRLIYIHSSLPLSNASSRPKDPNAPGPGEGVVAAAAAMNHSNQPPFLPDCASPSPNLLLFFECPLRLGTRRPREVDDDGERIEPSHDFVRRSRESLGRIVNPPSSPSPTTPRPSSSMPSSSSSSNEPLSRCSEYGIGSLAKLTLVALPLGIEVDVGSASPSKLPPIPIHDVRLDDPALPSPFFVASTFIGREVAILAIGFVIPLLALSAGDGNGEGKGPSSGNFRAARHAGLPLSLLPP